MKIIRFVNYPG